MMTTLIPTGDNFALIGAESRFGHPVKVYDDGFGPLWILRDSMGITGIIRAQNWEDAWSISEDEFFPAADEEGLAFDYEKATAHEQACWDENYGHRGGGRAEPDGGCSYIYQKDLNGEHLDRLTAALMGELEIKIETETDPEDRPLMSDEYDHRTSEHRGYSIKVCFHTDDHHGPPWKEHDGHGPVSDWTNIEAKQPGERVLSKERGSYRFYNWQLAMVTARKDGWGLSDESKAALAKRMGKAVTALRPGEITAEAVLKDFEYLQGWCNDEWHWAGYTTEITTPDGETFDGDSCWGYSSDDDDYMLSCALDSALVTINDHADSQEKLASLLRGVCEMAEV